MRRAGCNIVNGNVFDALGFGPEESLDLKLRSDILMIVHRIISRKKYNVHQLQRILGENQPVRELFDGKLDKLSLSQLVCYVARLGRSIEVGEATV